MGMHPISIGSFHLGIGHVPPPHPHHANCPPDVHTDTAIPQMWHNPGVPMWQECRSIYRVHPFYTWSYLWGEVGYSSPHYSHKRQEKQTTTSRMGLQPVFYSGEPPLIAPVGPQPGCYTRGPPPCRFASPSGSAILSVVQPLQPATTTGAKEGDIDLWAKEKRYSTSIRNPGCATPITCKHGPLGTLNHITSKIIWGDNIDPRRPTIDTNPQNDWRNSVGNISAEYA